MLLRLTVPVAVLAVATAPGVGAAEPDAGNEFTLQGAGGTAKAAHGATASKIAPTRTEAAMKLFVVDKDKGPVKGVVIFLTGPDKTKYYAEPTDSEGYAEVLVPVGQRYDITFLSLGRQEIAATVPVEDEPNQSVKLTLRYKREFAQQPFILAGVNFDTAKATIRPESFSNLDAVVEFMVHKKRRARRDLGPHRQRGERQGQQDAVGKARASVPQLHRVEGHRQEAAGRHRLRRRAPHRPQRHRRGPPEEPPHRSARAAVGQAPPRAPRRASGDQSFWVDNVAASSPAARFSQTVGGPCSGPSVSMGTMGSRYTLSSRGVPDVSAGVRARPAVLGRRRGLDRRFRQRWRNIGQWRCRNLHWRRDDHGNGAAP